MFNHKEGFRNLPSWLRNESVFLGNVSGTIRAIPRQAALLTMALKINELLKDDCEAI
ncbi:hypothetical protein D3C73_1113630 [compost metagenome]|uniref:Uncharacterized protein n=1 Tax=Paenibacillus jilunlii TaxID=682956 RepID=A0A1G9JY85_9BACL|nr:hypothetical protein SAMN05216191_10345 [Paenibacillus jilunlii]